MSASTKIEWCDSTFNPWIGCTRVSPACDDCYAARSTPARAGKVQWGTGMPRHRTGKDNWHKPEVWNRRPFVECDNCGFRGEHPAQIDSRGLSVGRSRTCDQCHRIETFKPARRRVFCASLADWLDNEVPIAWLVDLLDLIRLTPNLDWLLLTKRIGNWRGRAGAALNASNSIELREWLALWLQGDAPNNVWLGATVVNQAEVDRDVPKLLAAPARVRFLSIEPMLGAIRLDKIMRQGGGNPEVDDVWTYCDNALDGFRAHKCGGTYGPKLNWVIVGGESGPKSRIMHIEWARSLRDQCAAAGVPYLFKQWGEHNDCGEPVGKKKAGRVLDGRFHNGFPREKAA